MCNRKIQWPTIPVWWQKKRYCSNMPNVESAIDGTSHEIQIPSTEPQQKNILSANQFFSLISKGDNHYLKKNSSHLEWRVGLSDTILKGTHTGTIYARFGPYIDASCQVWLHLAKLFQRRIFFNIIANQKKELILAAMLVGRMEPNEEAL